LQKREKVPQGEKGDDAFTKEKRKKELVSVGGEKNTQNRKVAFLDWGGGSRLASGRGNLLCYAEGKKGDCRKKIIRMRCFSCCEEQKDPGLAHQEGVVGRCT